MKAREAIAHALQREGPLCAGCVTVVAGIHSHARVMELSLELARSGHVIQERRLCPGCQETRLVARRTEKDIRDLPPPPKKALRGTALEEALLYANPAVVPGSLGADPNTGEPIVTLRCLEPGCDQTERVRIERLPKLPLCLKHRQAALLETAQSRLKRALGPQSPASPAKVAWRGRVISVQPRIRLLRSFDERTHSYLGYVLEIMGTMANREGITFQIAVGQGAHEKHRFRVGDEIAGESVPVADPELESAGYYKTSALAVQSHRAEDASPSPDPPYRDTAPSLAEYRVRGHRRLDPITYAAKCSTCVWGCRMPVEIVIDHWNRSRGPDNVRRRMETFCYGPDGCPSYRAGPVRRVPGRKGMVHSDDGDSRGER